MKLSKREKRRLRQENTVQESHESQKVHEQRTLHQNHAQPHAKSPKSKYYIIGGAIIAVILAAAAYSAYSISGPGEYDGFAKCLTKKGAVMYGAMDWCKFTQAQKAMFGRSFKYVDYHEFNELPGIKKTPTWVISGAWHENVQPFDKLASLTGCKI